MMESAMVINQNPTWDAGTSGIIETDTSCSFPSSRCFLCSGPYLFILWEREKKLTILLLNAYHARAGNKVLNTI